MVGVFAGSFCPITKGHVDVIEKAAKLVDKLYVVVGINVGKHYVLSTEQRTEFVKLALNHIKNVEVAEHDGLMTDFCKKVGAKVMIKSIRNATDLQEVVDLCDATENLWDGQTIFIVGDKKYRFVSSSFVRELAHFNQDISPYVPAACAKKLQELLTKQN